MSNPRFMECSQCRPIWQTFRMHLDDAPPADRARIIGAYMDMVHNADHDEAAVLARLKADHEAAEERRSDLRRAFLLWAMVGEMSKPVGVVSPPVKEEQE